VPHSEQTLASFQLLAQHYSDQHVQWRYDPIIFTKLTDADWHRRTFARLVEQVAGLTRRCYFSFLDIYGKVTRNIRQLPPELQPYDPPAAEKIDLARELATIAAAQNIVLYTCAEDFAVGMHDNIHRGSCVDKNLLDELWPHKQRTLKLCSNRGKCGCYDSRDIGAYDTCPHGCIYCYAVLNRPLALKRYDQHDPDHDALLKRASDTPPEPPTTAPPVPAQTTLPLVDLDDPEMH
jgi:hypothetical protein